MKLQSKQILDKDITGQEKHIAVSFKLIKDYNKKEVIKVVYCESRVVRADIPTKTIDPPRLMEIRQLISLV
ncbi:hypothetical protein KXD40_005834 [Peronospora effusa]|uniref:Uncharacterized protein n=1 Tax=Peronospora effusa TaxID=542832 RepID=A0A3M6VHW0_9STRA|nr:hypothetical protein DD238_004863 [Peronospora effusa]RQM14826.1 hypothetical protein DD237_003274 [Peronospora effusa]UIZ27381.1 hypothetical protein KXD40_005834 [Peronospora effusa]